MVSKEISSLLTQESYIKLAQRKAGTSLGKYFFATNRFGEEKIEFIIKISLIGNNAPIEIYGEVMDLKNGIIFEATQGNFYACQIKGKVADDQLKKIKTHFVDQINKY
jgi:hypothetical protein